MASMIASSSATQTEPKRPLMPNKLLKAVIDGNKTDLKQLLGLNDEQPPPHMNVLVQEGTPTEPSESDLLRSAAGMENTILHILSANDHANLVSTICMKDSSLLKARNARNETPFHHAARFGHINTISELIHCAKSAFGEDGLKELLRQKNCLGETALHESARHGHGAVVPALMEEDWELVGLVNDDSVSPLYLATARGSLDMVRNMVAKMIDHKITPDFYSGPKKQTAMHAAVLQVQGPELTEVLLQLYSEQLGKGADETGRTPLHFIASTGNHNMANLLLDKDPSLAYIQDSDGSFPVHTAVRMGHVKMIVVLLQRCLDSGDLLDGNGRNLLHIAVEANKSEVIFKLLKDLENELSISHWKKMFNRMINTMDNEGNTPLHLATEHGYVNIMDSLSEEEKNGLDLTLQNKEGLTAFDISEIQLTESERKIKSRDILGEYYVQNRRAHFKTTGWFQYYIKEQMQKSESIRGTTQDHIPATDARGSIKSSENPIDKAQLVGLGSVLIATVTFAAAFTVPGGTGTPIREREYILKAFVLADFSAFFLSFLSTLLLIYSASDENSHKMEMHVNISMTLFAVAAKCVVITLTLGMYIVLAPFGKTIVALIFVFGFFLLVIENPNGSREHFRRYYFRTQLNQIPGVNLDHQNSTDSSFKKKNSTDSTNYYCIGNLRNLDPFPVFRTMLTKRNLKFDQEILYILYKRYIPLFAPLIFIFAVAKL